jgi:hypothetical protein
VSWSKHYLSMVRCTTRAFFPPLAIWNETNLAKSLFEA